MSDANKQSPKWEDLSSQELELLDKHIDAMRKGEYGVVTWPDMLNDRIRAIRQHLLDQNPYLVDDLKDAARDTRNSFLPSAEKPNLPILGQGRHTEKLFAERLHDITEGRSKSHGI